MVMSGASGFFAETNECEGEDEKAAQQGQPDEIGHSVFLPVPGAAGWNRHFLEQPQGQTALRQGRS